MATAAAAGSSRRASGFKVGWLDSDLFLVVGVRGRCGHGGGGGRCGVPTMCLCLRLPGVEEEGREGHRAAPAWWDPLWPSFAVAAMHHRIHPSTFLRYSSFTWSHSIHMVITCYYS